VPGEKAPAEFLLGGEEGQGVNCLDEGVDKTAGEPGGGGGGGRGVGEGEVWGEADEEELDEGGEVGGFEKAESVTQREGIGTEGGLYWGLE